MKTKAILTTCRDALLGACALLLTACDIIDYHPYDTRTSGPHHLNASNIQRIEKLYAGRDSVRFVLISDTQRWYDETREAVKSINARGDIDFVLHCGDISDFGVTREFELQRDILCKLDVPFVVLLGNHDCLGTGENVFQWIFGEPNFSFNVGDIHHMDMGTLLDRLGIAVRTGHHCAEPLMHRLGVQGTARASFGLYNTFAEVDALVEGIRRVSTMF